MRGPLQTTSISIVASLCLMLACDRSPRRGPVGPESDQSHARAEPSTRTAQASLPEKPMRVGGEVSAPKPRSALNIKWRDDPAQCYQLGVAVFEGAVDRSGSAHQITLIKGPDNEFTRAAREAISQQKFEPAMYHGKPVDVTYHVSVNHVPLRKVKGPC